MGTGLGMILKVVVINNDQLGKIGNMSEFNWGAIKLANTDLLKMMLLDKNLCGKKLWLL